MRRRRARAFLLATVFVTIGCGGSGDRPLDQVDPDAAPENPTYDQVFAILHNRCVTCHSSDSDDTDYADGRVAAGGVEPNLEDCVQIVAFAGDIVVQVEGNMMPPGAMPRLTNEEKLIIQRWYANGKAAPCN